MQYASLRGGRKNKLDFQCLILWATGECKAKSVSKRVHSITLLKVCLSIEKNYVQRSLLQQ